MSLHSFKHSARLALHAAIDRTRQLLGNELPTQRRLQAEGLEERVLMSASPAVVVADAVTIDAPNAQPSLDQLLQAVAVEGRVSAPTIDVAALSKPVASDGAIVAQVRELVFLDPNAPEVERLIADLSQQRADGRAIDLVMLDDTRDGVDQISDALSHYSGLEAVHVVSHGDDGEVWLGSTRLNLSLLGGYVGEFARWGQSLSSDADILFYGCRLAANDDGQWLMDAISVLTGADVAASTDITGNARLGGDWQLEFQHGEVTAPVAFTPQLQVDWFGTLDTKTFQDGTNGYAGTNDTMIRAADTASSFGTTTLLTTQDQGGSGEEQTLIRFDNLFGNAVGQIPYGSTINSAQLIVEVTDPAGTGDIISAYRMLIPFTESSTWNSLTNGVQTNNVDATSAAVATLTGSAIAGPATISGLESTVQQWADGVPNYGLVFKKLNSNSWGFQSSETTTVSQRPQLVVSYTPPPNIRVDTTNDVLDGDTSSISALLSTRGTDGKISLREAITAANNTVGTNEIEVPAGAYTLALTGGPEDSNVRGDLDITDSVKITGAGSSATIINGGAIDRVFDVLVSGSVTLQDLTITNGSRAGANGGGIQTSSTTALTLERVVVANNSANEGAAIYSQGALQLLDSTVRNNTAQSFGGGLSAAGVTTVTGSTFTGNSAANGGGIAVSTGGPSVSITNTTLAANNTTTGGAAIHTAGTVSISSSTIAFNTGGGGAGGIKVAVGGSATVQNSILSSNAGGNASGTLTSNGHNIDSDGTAGLNQPSDRSNLDPRLATLADNGGLTETVALLADSPAIGSGAGIGITVDQRGFGRGAFSDIGAYQRAPRLTSTIEQRVNETTSDVQATVQESRNSQAISISPTGETVVVWSSNLQDGSSTGIYARRYDHFGAPIGSEFRINQETIGAQSWAAVDHDEQGRFVVVWTSDGQDGSGNGVYARMYDANGTARTGDLLVNSTTSNQQKSPSLAVAPDGSFVVVWEGEGTGDTTGIFYRRFDANGVAQDASEQRANAASGMSETRASVAMNGNKDFVVVWDDSEDVWAQKYHWDGTEVGINTRLDGMQDNARNAVVGMAADGSYVVAMQVTTVIFGEGIYAQRVDKFGDAAGANVLVNGTTLGDQTRPAIAVAPTGEFFVTWSGNGSGDTAGVFVRKFAANGSAMGNETRVNVTTTNVQDDASVALLDDGNFAVVWSGNGPGDADGVFYRALGSDPVGAIAKGASDPVIDNTVDAIWSTAPSHSIGLTSSGTIANAADLSAHWQALWTTTGLYVLTTVTDDVIVNDSGTSAFNDDIVEVFLDSNQSRNTSYDGANDFQFGFRVGDSAVHVGSNSLATTTGIVFTTTNVSATSYRVEALIPWSVLGVTPTDGLHFGFDVQVGDDDDGGNRDAKIAWADPLDQAISNPNLMATGELVAAVTPNSVPTANANGPYLVAANGSVTLSSAGSNDSDGTIAAYEWDLDYDGSTFNVDATAVAPVFSASGLTAPLTRAVGLRVRDNQGAVSAVSTANVTVVGDTTVNTTLPGSQTRADVASNPAGRTIVVWEDPAADGSGSGILGQLYDSDGTRIGGEFVVASTVTGNQSDPSVSMNDTGEFVVTWTSYGLNGDSTAEGNIYARLFAANGTASGNEFLVNTTTSGMQHESAVSFEFQDNRFMVVWSSVGQDGDGSGIYGQLFDATGGIVKNEFRVNSTTVGDQSNPDVGGNGYQEFSVVWQSVDQDGSGLNIYEQRYKRGNDTHGTETPINTTTTGNQYDPAVGMERDGDRFFVWTSDGQDGDGSGIYGDHILYGGSGSNNAGEFRVNSTTAGAQSAPSIALDENGSAVITWQSTGQSGDGPSESNIYAQIYAISAQRPQANGGEFQINTYSVGSQLAPRVTAEFDGDFTVVWTGAGQNDADGVFLRHFTGGLSNGAPEVTATTSVFSFTEGDAPRLLDAGLLISDPDTANLTGATVAIRDNFVAGADVLTVGTQAGIATNFNSLTGTLTLSGTATVSAYQAILRTVAYQNLSENPGTLSRPVAITVSDGLVDGEATLAIDLVAVNDAPTITSNGGGGAASVSVTENSTAVATVTATDLELSPLTYSINGGADAAAFVIDSATGVLSFVSAPNYETPTDSNLDNVYEVIVSASDGVLSDTQAISVTVVPLNESAPVISSNGGGATASVSVAENSTAVTTVTATDADLPAQTLTYSISGGTDAGRFAINSATGALAFQSAPNYETPADVNADNVYEVIVRVSDGSLTGTQTISVTVTPVNESAPNINSNGAGPTATVSVAENSTAVTTVSATDADLPTQTLTYSISGGTDAGRFAINGSTGALSFVSAPNYEAPTDSNADNVYNVIVQASDGSLTDTQSIAVSVAPVNDNNPVITSNGGGATATVSVVENSTAVTTVTATDADLPTQTLTYSISGTDAARFTINSSTGELSFVAAPNFEAPTDSNADNNYVVTVAVSDGTRTDVQTLSVTVSNANDIAPVITAGQTFSVIENASVGASLGFIAATDADGATTFQNWTITGGNSSGAFGIDASTGELLVMNPAALNASVTPTYTLTLTVSDGVQASNPQTVVVTVQSAAPGTPIANDDSYSLNEGGSLNQSVISNWFNASWKYRQRLTFNNSASSTDLVDTEVLVRLHASAADAVRIDYSQTQDAGQDLRFVDANGNVLAHEIEQWDETGYSYVWVNVPRITAGSTSDFISMYYGNANALTGSAPAAVWDATDVGVYHMHTSAIDSSNYSNDGGVSNVVTTSGQIAGAGLFNGASSTINAGSDASLDNIFAGGGTVSAWIRPTGWGENGYGRIFDKAASTSSANGWAVQLEQTSATTGRLLIEHDFTLGVGRWRSAAGSITLNNWQQVVVVYDNSSLLNVPKVYVNGVEVGVTTSATPVGLADSDAALNLAIGNRNGATDRTFDGKLDEVRLSTAMLSADEIAAQFRAGVGTYISGGIVEVGPGGLLNNDRDPTGQPLTVTLVSGPTHSGSFTLNADGSFQYTHDGSETTTDSFTYRVSNGSLTDLATVTLNIAGVNDAPAITSNGGGATGSVAVPENSAAVTVVTATDSDLPTQTLTYSIVGGTDAARFMINATTGALSFVSAPDFEAPTDSNADNVYQVNVRVSDGSLSDTQTLSVTVTAQNDNTPNITSNGGGATASVAVNENSTAVTTVTASDADLPTAALSYTITGGADAGRFSINSSTGALRFVTAPDFETPTDANADNIYEVIVRASDGSLTDTQSLSVSINARNDNDPVITSDGGSATPIITLTENQTAVTTVTATDADLPAQTLTYSIVGGFDETQFTINATTGELRYIAVFDFEAPTDDNFTNRYYVTVQVSDGIRTALQDIRVDITDLNEAPTMDAGTLSIAENSANGTLVGTATASDVDAFGTQSFSIVSGNTNGAFAIDPLTGDITVTNSAALNFEVTPTFNLVLRVTDSGGLTSDATTTISLTNRNEAPTMNSGIFSLSENSANGTLVGTATGNDPDAGDVLSYSLVGGNPNNAFSIDATTGKLTVANAAALDFESTPSFSLAIRATDTGGKSQTATTVISLTNQNDPPVVQAAAFTLSENSVNGSLVGTLTATDPDSSDSRSFALIGGNTSGAFAVNALTGALTIANSKALDFEVTPVFNLTVRVTDAGGLTSDAPVTVSLSNQNEAPSMSSGAFVVTENAANGSLVGTVSAMDPDASDVLSYSLQSGNANGAFAIDAMTGKLTVANSAALDFETTPSLSLVIRVTDAGGLTNDATTTISLTNRNEAPTMNSGLFSLPENTANGSVVGTVSGNDPDAGDLLSYSILSGNLNGAFAINATTGELTVANAAALDFETTPTFNLVIRAMDQAGLTSDALTQISLNNRNEAPTMNAASFVVSENNAAGKLIGSASATDPDASDSLSYAIISGNPSGAFAINATTGKLTVAKSEALDFESSANFALVIRVTDAGGMTSDATTLIALSNVNEAPTMTPGAFTISENSANGSFVGTATASDPDANDPLSYAIVGGNPSGAFSIHAATGKLSVANAAAVNFETLPNFSLVIRATDSNGLMSDATTTISLSNVNEAPTMPAGTFTIAENAANGASVGTVTASDPDAGDSLSYAIIGGNSTGAFAINGTTGALTVANAAALDFETSPNFSLVIRATDANGLTSDATTKVTLSNINEAPTMTSGSFTITENSANGTLVGTATGTDPDASTTLSYSIIGGNPSGAFAINTTSGAITVAKSAALNFEATPFFNLAIRATDAGGLFDDTTTTISLSNQNEAPLLNAATFTLPENSAVGTPVGSLSATDPDASDTHSFSIINGNSNGAFSINASTGVISVANSAALDFEQSPTFTLGIRVTDAGGLSSTATATIQLTNRNEAPSLAPATFTVPENSANGASVGTVTSIDPDAGDTRNFAIMAGNNGGTFAINSVSGAITVADRSLLDFETTATFTLTVRVTDSGNFSDTATVTINLSNVNESPTTTGHSDIVITEDSTLTLNLSNVFADIESPDSALTMTAASSNTALMPVRTMSGMTLTMTPRANATGTTTITVTARDPGGLSVSTSFVVTVTPVEDAPVATADQFVVTGSAMTVAASSGVLANDWDPDGDALSVTLISSPSVGTLSFNADGSFEFIAPANFIGSTAFTYAVSDGVMTTTGTVTLVALAAPAPATSNNNSSDTPTSPPASDTGPTDNSSPSSSSSTTAPAPGSSPNNDNDSDNDAPPAPVTNNGGGVFGFAPPSNNGSSSNSDDQNDNDNVFGLGAVLLKKVEDSTSTGDRMSSLGSANGSLRAGGFTNDDLSTSLMANLRFDGEDMTYLADASFLKALDKAEQSAADQAAQELVITEWAAGGAIVTSTGLSVGYIIWLIRGGYVLASVVSTMPVWQNVDPLPVLDALADDDEDDESLEQMIAKAEGTESVVSSP